MLSSGTSVYGRDVLNVVFIFFVVQIVYSYLAQ